MQEAIYVKSTKSIQHALVLLTSLGLEFLRTETAMTSFLVPLMLGCVVTRDVFRWEGAGAILVHPSGWDRARPASSPPRAQVEALLPHPPPRRKQVP